MNVTIPYKKAIIPYLASISEEARAIGAVNCVRLDATGAMHGYNTDVEGIRATLAPYAEQLRGGRALVLGSGGAAAAVVYVLSYRAWCIFIDKYCDRNKNKQFCMGKTDKLFIWFGQPFLA